MKRSARTKILLIAAIVLLWPPQSAFGEIRFVGEGATQYFSCEDDGPHFKKLEIFQRVQNDYDHLESVPLLLAYSRDLATPRSADRVKTDDRAQVKIHVLRGNRWVKIGVIKAYLYAEDDEIDAEKFKLFDVELKTGDLLRWRFKFPRFSDVEEGDQMRVLAAVLPAALEE